MRPDPPENCHLNVKKLSENCHFFSKIAKKAIFSTFSKSQLFKNDIFDVLNPLKKILFEFFFSISIFIFF